MTVINVENIGKCYRLGEKKEDRYDTFRNMLWNGTRKSLRRLIGVDPAPTYDDFWALREISFNVKQGQRVGIIGRNGAGKSTLLKLLSRITEPTEGRITMRGRVGSLLEVGTGFHPELTGRENIYLNGAVLGMGHQETRRKFDEIVDFSGIEQFLDTPVKRYSSGMYVRLAFAVAAHLEPDVLIIDEVLAVGDAAFQKKCLGKMDEVGRSGRTLLFVSHSMAAISQMCDRCVLLKRGRVDFFGDAHEASQRYLQENQNDSGAAGAVSEWSNTSARFNRPQFTPERFMLTDAEGKPVSGSVMNNDDIWVQIEGYIDAVDEGLTIGYALYTGEGTGLYWSYPTDRSQDSWPVLKSGKVVFKSKIPQRFLNEGSYRVELLGGLHFREWFFEPGQNPPSLELTIEGGVSDSPYWTHKRPTVLSPVIEWETYQ